jgi:hypothetical protein
VDRPRSFILVAAPYDIDVPTTDAARDYGERPSYIRELGESLVGMGHEVEVWAVQGPEAAARELLADGLLVRRFRARRDYLVPRVRPAEWISEWTSCASDHLSRMPGLLATLVTFHWESGIAGRTLATRFGLAHVHVPQGYTADRSSGQFLAGHESPRRIEEDRRTCETASAVVVESGRAGEALQNDLPTLPFDRLSTVPRGRDFGRRFLAALPQETDVLSSSTTLASADEVARSNGPVSLAHRALHSGQRHSVEIF